MSGINEEDNGGGEVFTEEVVTETQTPETSDTTAPESKDAGVADAPAEGEQPAAEGETPPPAAPAFEPTLKFKAFGKEHEIDPLFKDIIKDEATQKKVQEIFEKAAGMEGYKARVAQAEKAIQEVYEPMAFALKEAAEAYASKDFDSLFKKLKIPETEILKWVDKKIQIAQLPEEQRELYNRQQEASRRAASLEANNQLLLEREQQYLASQRSFEVEQGIASLEVKEVAALWDSIYGEGSFKSEVIKTGQFEFMQNRRDLSAKEAIGATVQRLKPLYERLKPSASATPPASKAPVIPNPQGRTGSPAKKAITSLDQIRKLAASMD